MGWTGPGVGAAGTAFFRSRAALRMPAIACRRRSVTYKMLLAWYKRGAFQAWIAPR
jgi:hypothetical protein